MHPDPVNDPSHPQSAMMKARNAFEVLARILKLNGRKRLRAELEVRMRLHRPEEVNAARSAPMAKRAERRAVIRSLRKQSRLAGKSHEEIARHIFFRPVIGYLGLPAPDHKATVKALVSSRIGAVAWREKTWVPAWARANMTMTSPGGANTNDNAEAA